MVLRGRGEEANVVSVGVFTVEWSCLKDFSLLAGEVVLDNLQSLKCTISSLTTVTRASLLRTSTCLLLSVRWLYFTVSENGINGVSVTMKLLLRSVCRSHVCPLAVMHVFVCSRRVISDLGDVTARSLRLRCALADWRL